MWPGQVPLETTGVQAVANDGTSISTAQSVQLLYLLMVLCSCGKATLKISTVFAISRGSATTFILEGCAWVSGLVIVERDHLVTPTPVGTLCPGYSSTKFLRLSRRCREDKTSIAAKKNTITAFSYKRDKSVDTLP